MPKTGLVSRSLPSTAATAPYANTPRPTTRRATRNPVESTSRARRAGAGRPLVASSYRGLRQATARTVNETTRAATAPAIASSGETGRSFAPPMPCANGMPSGLTSADLELDDGLVDRVGLDVDDARGLDGLDLEGAGALVVLELLLGRGVHVDLARRVRGDLQLDRLAVLDLDPVAVRRDRVTGEGDLDDLRRRARPGARGRGGVTAAAPGRGGRGAGEDSEGRQGTTHG